MAPQPFSYFLTISLLAFVKTAQASFNEEVEAAVYILHDLPGYLASPFCSDYIHYHDPTETYTVTEGAVTIKTTVAPLSCSTSWSQTKPPITPAYSTLYSTSTPDLITVTSTTTITYITTSTIFVAPTGPAERQKPKFIRDIAGFFPNNRATWCSDYDVPCRLVQYDHEVIAAACENYLHGGRNVVTIITTEYGPTVTSTVMPNSCTSSGEEYQAEYSEGYDEHGDHYAPELPHSSDNDPPPHYESEDDNHEEYGKNEHDEKPSDDSYSPEKEEETAPPTYSFEDGNDAASDPYEPTEPSSDAYPVSDEEDSPAPDYIFEDGNNNVETVPDDSSGYRKSFQSPEIHKPAQTLSFSRIGEDDVPPHFNFEDGNDYAEDVTEYVYNNGDEYEEGGSGYDYEEGEDEETGPPNYTFEDGNDFEPRV
ncbi:hypothetical protein BKA66DRAFT_583924 [Pyrenochaeta sp. MPI-SDFR-AT-0127]|nr:hypothetical protein BKA66DRAFT_583924 [Pyrenochaeta sp. MPI-SDFR-AT-0127]